MQDVFLFFHTSYANTRVRENQEEKLANGFSQEVAAKIFARIPEALKRKLSLHKLLSSIGSYH
jgi:hypothetical protein